MGRVIMSGIAPLLTIPKINVANMTFEYTGDMIDDGIVAMSDGNYRLLTLTSSGIFTPSQNIEAEIWMCGGGSGGCYHGGGGAGAKIASGTIVLSGSLEAVIGAGGAGASSNEPVFHAGGATSFGGIQTPVAFSCPASAYGVSGGTGGGGSSIAEPGYGDGVSKYPFNDTVYFPDPYCAGGGGGMNDNYSGGSGGTNGGNGGYGVSGAGYVGGAGGHKGGGDGGDKNSVSNYNGRSATFYGSGGGGGSDKSNYGYGGAGYQGVIHIRIPA